MNGSLSDLGKLGFRTVAMALTDNSISIDNPVLVTEPQLAIVMGTEGDGLPPETIAEADYVVRIPMSPGVRFTQRSRCGCRSFLAVSCSTIPP